MSLRSLFPSTDAHRASVFVIDGQTGLASHLRSAMATDGVEFVELGETAASALVDPLAAVRATAPGVVLLDLDIPGAMLLLRQIKDDPQVGQTPVLALTGRGGVECKLAAFDLGASDCLAKPFELMELRARLRAQVRVNDLVRMLAHRAHLDGLTGLWNRAHFEERWNEEHARAQRAGHALSLAMVDIDHFKVINDTHGHPVGDVVLRGVGGAIQRGLRESDLCCRYGGEEFVVIMPDTSLRESIVVAERLRTSVEAMTWPGLVGMRTTVSVGVAGIESGQRGPGVIEWIEAADKALYAAKQSGRNRVSPTAVGTDRARMAS